ncbi:MAG: YdbL family protein [Rhodospirillaceae bacterium]|nr:YdbL family protein [Rhodospirillaceae bacterium]
MMSRRLLAAAVAALMGLAIWPAAAIELDQARAQGLVGERPDGLVGAVSAPSAEVKALVDTVNAARMAEYKSIAQKNGTPVEAVQAIAGEKQVQRAKENKWYMMDAAGKWMKP